MLGWAGLGCVNLGWVSLGWVMLGLVRYVWFVLYKLSFH